MCLRFLLAFALANLAAVPARAAEVHRGRCAIDVCAWFLIQEKNIVASDKNGALFRVTLQRFTTRRANDRPPPRKAWEVSEGYVLCSKTRPAVLFQSGGEWLAHILAPAQPSAYAGYNLTSHVQYFAVCHGVGLPAIDEPMLAKARALGYPAGGASEQIKLSKPEDILNP